jgi:hypothetical protein
VPHAIAAVELGKTSKADAKPDHPIRLIAIRTYRAIIASMSISLWTGRKPTPRTYEMIRCYSTGLADEEELIAHIAKLPRHDR